MNSITLTFGKDKTAIIKGIAIIFMIMLHCGVADVLKLCVGIFTFMVGYGYAFAKNKDWRYSLHHIKKLLIPFWTILFVFILPVLYIQGNLGGAKMILLNMFGINSVYNFFSWFVAFYIYCMIVMPFISRIIDKKPIAATTGFVTLAFVLEAAVHAIPGYTDNDWTQRLFDCLLCTPCMLLGYLFAHEGWFTRIRIPKKSSMLFIVFAVMLIVMVFILRSYFGSVAGFNLDFFYAPLFILSVLIVFNLYHLPVLTKVLSVLGDVSVYMWFFHALFFTDVVCGVYKPLISISDNLWVVTPWTILLTFISSWCISNVMGFVQKELK
jgi:hypothetical protein